VNDEGIPEHVENMENLLRGLLDLPNKPAVVLVEALAFSTGGMGGGGGRMHLPVAQYFDVPVVNQRHPLASHFGRYPQLLRPYFAEKYVPSALIAFVLTYLSSFWGDPDTRHVNSRGHRDLANLIASLVRDVTCEMLSETDFYENKSDSLGTPILDYEFFAEANRALNEASSPLEIAAAQDAQIMEEQAMWPEQSRAWRQNPSEGEEVGTLMPGVWTTPLEYGLLPRMRVLNGWNPDPNNIVPPFHPICLSTRSKDLRFNLTPSTSEGWGPWVHPDYLDKPYLVARSPGATVSFEMETTVGVVKMYSLRSMTFGLGTVECWADGEKARAVKVVGWWDNPDA